MNKEDLYLPKSPWVYIAASTPSDSTNFGWSLVNDGPLRVVVRFLRGSKMTKLSDLDNEVAAALQFPWYYGENWAAFDECITDLDWLPGDAYVLIITDAQAVLSEENEEQFATFVKIIQKAGEEWGQPVETSEAWSRPSVPFHVIFQCTESDKQGVISRLKSIGASFQEIYIEGAK